MPFAEFGVKIESNSRYYFRRIPYDLQNEKDTLECLIHEYNNTDIYRSIFSYDRKKFPDALIRGPLFFDFDFEHTVNEDNVLIREQVQHCIITLQQYLKLPLDQICLYYSGGKGFHVIVPPEVFGFEFSNQQKLLKDYRTFATVIKNEWQQRFHTEHSIDLRIYDRRRMFRIPNSFNRSGGGFKIRLPDIKMLSMHYADLQDLAKEPSSYEERPGTFCPIAQAMWNYWTEELGDIKTENKKKHLKKRNIKTLPCVTEILNTSISKGNRNNVAVVLANVLFQQGLSFKEVELALTAWNDSNEPPLPEQELYVTIKSARLLYDQDKDYGCSSIKQLGFCKKRCSIKRG